jgi:hypothetical protein
MIIITIFFAAVATLSPVSALAPPSNNPASHTTSLMPAALGSTRGGEVAASARSRSVELAAMSSSSAATQDDSGRKMSDALLSIRKCYRTCFFACAVDVTTTLIDKKIWSKIISPSGSGVFRLRWTDYVDIFDSMTLFIFALGLNRISIFYEGWMQDDEKRMDNQSLSSFFSLMCWMWRIVAFNFALDSLIDASILPQMSMKWLGLEHVSSSSLMAAVATALVLAYSVVNSLCERIATVEDEKDNNRIRPHQIESKTQPQYKSIRILGYRAFCGQALSTASFGINSCLKLSKWLVAADTGIVGRALSFNEWLEPFAMTTLLAGLNKAFLRAAIVRSREASREAAKIEMDEEIYRELFTAQTKFYTKVADVLKGM